MSEHERSEGRKCVIAIESARVLRNLAESVLTLESKVETGTEHFDLLAISAMCDELIEKALEKLIAVDLAMFKQVSEFPWVAMHIQNLRACGDAETLRKMENAGLFEQVERVAKVVEGYEKSEV